MEFGSYLMGNLASMVRNIDGKLVKKDCVDNIHESAGNEGMKPAYFVSMFKDNTSKKTVYLSELKNDECVSGADVSILLASVDEVSDRFANTLCGYFIGKRLAFPIVKNYVKNTWAKYGLERVMLRNELFFFQFATKEGMEQVFENGPWLNWLVHIILNTWTPNMHLKKDEITMASVWVKLHNVPIVAFSEVGLSLITTKLGRPIMLDTYITIPFQDRSGHYVEMIDTDYEWKLPRCDTWKIFEHTDEHCPKKPKTTTPTLVTDDSFVEVTRKGKGKHASKPQHIDGIRLTKPKPNYFYRPVSKSMNVHGEASTSQPIETVHTNTHDNEDVENVFVEDNGKPMDGLVDDARKKKVLEALGSPLKLMEDLEASCRRGRDDLRQNPKKRGTSKDVVASLDQRVARVEISMAKLKNQVEGLEGLDSDFASMREDFRVALNALCGDLKREIHDLRDSFMGEITKIQEEFGDEVSTLHQVIEALQANMALCKWSLASGGGDTNHGSKIDVPKPSPFVGKREAMAFDDFLWEMKQYLEGVNVVDDASKIKMATRYLKDTAKQFYPENTKNKVKSRLRKLKQSGTIREYVKEFTTLVLEIPELSDQDSLFYFLDGLQGWAKTELERCGV
ncbi:putative retrotransposon gag domain, aspartic peptidase domain protein [Tanacetum coccineum]